MIKSFKNTELFRYFIRVDINKSIDKIIKQNKSNFSLIAGSVFSGSFSILGTYFGMYESTYKNFCKIFITCVLFAFLFVVGMAVFKAVIYVCSFFWNAWKREKLPTKAKIKELIDDFDHIACDNILISQNFIEAFSESNTLETLKEFYFYEVIYYTKVSLSIIQKLFIYQDMCISDKENTNRVHLFRLENALKMLNEIYTFLESNKEIIKVDLVLRPSMYNEVTNLGEKLDKHMKSCQKLKDEKYPKD